MRIYYYLIVTAMLFTSCGYAQKQSEIKNAGVTDTSKNVITDKFEVLKFIAEEKPCEARINTKYKNFKNKFNYSLSVFINIKLPKNNKNDKNDNSLTGATNGVSSPNCRSTRAASRAKAAKRCGNDSSQIST